MKVIKRKLKVIFFLIALIFINGNTFGGIIELPPYYAKIYNEADNCFEKNIPLKKIIKINDNHTITIEGSGWVRHSASVKPNPQAAMSFEMNIYPKITEVINYTDKNGNPAIEKNVFTSGVDGRIGYDGLGKFPGPQNGLITHPNKNFYGVTIFQSALIFLDDQNKPYTKYEAYSSSISNGENQLYNPPAYSRSVYRGITIRARLRFNEYLPIATSFVTYNPDWSIIEIKKDSIIFDAKIILHLANEEGETEMHPIQLFAAQSGWTYID